MNSVVEVIYKIVEGIQVVAIAFVVVMICFTGIKFMTSGRDFSAVKMQAIGIVIGAVCVFMCIPLKDWLASIVGF